MKALLLVDIQKDFLPGGALAVPGGDEVVPVANRLMRGLGAEVIVATQDWHPADHASFASNHPGKQPYDVIELGGQQQMLWPDHCVQGSAGASFADRLDTRRIDRVFQTGTDPGIDSYSGFMDNARTKATGLGDYLEQRGVDQLFIVGLALDVCVLYTVLDARRLGFDTTLVLDGSRPVEVHPGDGERAVERMREAGVHVVESGALV